MIGRCYSSLVMLRKGQSQFAFESVPFPTLVLRGADRIFTSVKEMIGEGYNVRYIPKLGKNPVMCPGKIWYQARSNQGNENLKFL